MRLTDKALDVINIIIAILFVIFIPLNMWLGARASSTIVLSILVITFIVLRDKGELLCL